MGLQGNLCRGISQVEVWQILDRIGRWKCVANSWTGISHLGVRHLCSPAEAARRGQDQTAEPCCITGTRCMQLSLQSTSKQSSPLSKSAAQKCQQEACSSICAAPLWTDRGCLQTPMAFLAVFQQETLIMHCLMNCPVLVLHTGSPSDYTVTPQLKQEHAGRSRSACQLTSLLQQFVGQLASLQHGPAGQTT